MEYKSSFFLRYGSKNNFPRIYNKPFGRNRLDYKLRTMCECLEIL